VGTMYNYVLGVVYKIITRLQGIHKLLRFNHMNISVIFYNYLLTDIQETRITYLAFQKQSCDLTQDFCYLTLCHHIVIRCVSAK
jgi:hypothetical protein